MENKYYIVEEEFYSQGISLNIQLLIELLYKQNFNLKEDNRYKKNNIEILTKIVKDIEDKEIKFEYLKKFLNDDKRIIFEKLNVTTLIPDSDINPEEIYDNISKDYKEMKDALDKLSNYKDALEIYHSSIQKDNLAKINMLIEEIKKDTYKNYKIRKSEIHDLLGESYEIVAKIDEVKKSKIFKIFYQNEIEISEKNKANSSSIFDKAYEEFTKFKKSIIEKGADSQNDMIKIIKNQYEGEPKIQEELISLINREQQNEGEIMILLNLKSFENDLNAMIYFFSYFNFNENIVKELEGLKNKLKDFSFLNAENTVKMKNVLEELKTQEIYDYKKNIETKSNYIKLIDLFFENGQALAFLAQHTVEDIKPLYDIIEPNRIDLIINDISDTIKCVEYFQEFKNIDGGIKELIKYIQKSLDEKDSNILKKIKHYLEISQSVIEFKKNTDINNYKENLGTNSSIEIEIKPVNNKYGKFINIKKEDEKNYHIYFNNNKEEINRTYFDENEEIEKIKIIIDYEVKSFKNLFNNCDCIESINFKKFNRNNIINMKRMFYRCSSLKELNLNNFNTINITDMRKMFSGCSSLKELTFNNFNPNNFDNCNGIFDGCSNGLMIKIIIHN